MQSRKLKGGVFRVMLFSPGNHQSLCVTFQFLSDLSFTPPPHGLFFLRTFMQIYQMDCPRARERLLVMGVPEPIKSSLHDDASKVAVTVAETVQHFITTMDAVKVGFPLS